MLSKIDVKSSVGGDVSIVDESMDKCSRAFKVYLKATLDGISRKELYGFRLGYRLKKDGQIIDDFQYPVAGITLLRSDQPYLCVGYPKIIPNTYYELELWCKPFGGRESSTSYKFTSAKPVKQYPSWTWDDERKIWVAPIPMPDDGKEYEWDEKKQEWVEVDDDVNPIGSK